MAQTEVAMETISADVTVQQLLARHPCLVEVFQAHGLGKLVEPEALESLAPLLTLRSALAALSVNQEVFLAQLRARLESVENSPASEGVATANAPELTVSALLPCGMKMPFGRALEAFVDDYNRAHGAHVRCLVEGNVNHELSFYDRIDALSSLDDLPDIVISADINSFYHAHFKRTFRHQGLFRGEAARSVHPEMQAIGLADPGGDFTMLSANLLVPVVMHDRLPGGVLPRSWGDLLEEKFESQVVMRGDESFFCNGVLLPFYRLFGMEGIRRLGRSVIRGMHPSEMVKLIDSRSDGVPPVYVMPYFFAMKIKERQRVTIVIPREGALVSPVQMLVKRGADPHVQAVADYLAGPRLGQICADAYFPSAHAGVKNATSSVPLCWLGWDFLDGHDIGVLKDDVAVTFRTAFTASGGEGCA
jgi:ABC-type Fe3+ transport system substrate-binding protein